MQNKKPVYIVKLWSNDTKWVQKIYRNKKAAFRACYKYEAFVITKRSVVNGKFNYVNLTYKLRLSFIKED